MLRAKAQSQQERVTPWWEQDTRVYRVVALAEQWHVPPSEFLRWPAIERRLIECYLIAKGLKYEAAQNAQAHKSEEQQFDAKLQQWSHHLAQQARVQ